MEQLVLSGQKSGSSTASTPTEERNNLLSKSYAKVLLAVGEGEFAGVPTGQDIFLDGTPLISPSGYENYSGVTWEFRPGTVDQTYITGMPDLSSEYSVGFTLTGDTPYVRAISNAQLDAFRLTMAWPALYEQKDNGDIVGYNIQYAIDVATDGGAYVEQGTWDTNSGKTTVEYNRTHRINLPKPGTSWTIRVRRLTPNKNNAKFADVMTIKTYAEVIDAKLRYPNTALLFIEFDAQLFGGSSIPKISLKTKGRYVQVPSNYDADSRTYSGVWTGTFKWAWSNNPAWIFYDLVINERFGLGSRITADMVDKWTLYQVAQYCDVQVPDGNGGTEPRYTCNIYVQARKEAWQVLRDIVTIFNGMLFWSGTQMVASADMPVATNTVRTYNRSSVVDGKFSYGSTSEKTIYTTALVSFDDPLNHYETAVEATNDVALVQRYKTWAQAEVSAIGCTSRGEAQRKGKYTMLTNSLNRLVTFKLGLEGYLPQPGEVFGVADQILAGSNFAGRISNATISTVTLDRVPNAAAGDILYINKADGTTGEGRTIQSIDGKVITVTADYTAVPSVELSWYIEKTTLKSQLYRVTKVTWDDDAGQYEIQGVQYEDSKYAAVDNGARIESRPITNVPAGGQEAPASVTLTTYTYLEQTMAVTSLSVAWPQVSGAMNYEGQWRKDGGDWNNVGLTASTGFTVAGIYSGAYQARVRAINVIGTKSVWTTSDNVEMTGKAGAPPTLVAFSTVSEIFATRVNWEFQDGADDGAYIQLQTATDATGLDTAELSFVAYPAKTYLKSNMLGGAVLFYRGRLIDRSGNQSAWTDWTYGISEYGTTAILESITGEITKTELAQELLAEIDTNTATVKDLTGTVTDLNGRVTDLQGNVADLQEQIQAATNAIEYNKDTSYAKGDIVHQGERLYQATQAVPANNAPPNATYWLDVGNSIEQAGATAQQVTLNTAKITQMDGTLTSQATQLSGLTSRITDAESAVAGNADAINSLTTTVNDIDGVIEAAASDLRSLSAQVRDDDGSGDLSEALKLYQNSADIITERTVRASKDEAFASDITSMKATVAQNAADIITEQTTRATQDSALSSSIVTIQASTAQNAADIISERTARTTATDSIASDITTIKSNVNANAAAITAERTARTTATDSLASDVTSIKSSVAQNASDITAERTARSSAIDAVAKDVTTTQASVQTVAGSASAANTAASNANAAALQAAGLANAAQTTANTAVASVQTVSSAQATTDGKLTAMYSVKVGVNSNGQYYGAGMGIGVENTPSGMQSQILFVADRFAILNTVNGAVTTPFVVQNGQVIANSAIFGDATISFAKIGDNIQSTNFVSGSTGWKLSKDGTFEINGSVGGGRMSINNQAIKVYDANGVKRVQLGNLDA